MPAPSRRPRRRPPASPPRTSSGGTRGHADADPATGRHRDDGHPISARATVRPKSICAAQRPIPTANVTALSTPKYALSVTAQRYAGLCTGNMPTGATGSPPQFEGRYGETRRRPALHMAIPTIALSAGPSAAGHDSPAVRRLRWRIEQLRTATRPASVLGMSSRFQTQLFPNSAANSLAADVLRLAPRSVGRGVIGLDCAGNPAMSTMLEPALPVQHPSNIPTWGGSTTWSIIPICSNLSLRRGRGRCRRGDRQSIHSGRVGTAAADQRPRRRALPSRLAALLRSTVAEPQSFRPLVTTDSCDRHLRNRVTIESWDRLSPDICHRTPATRRRVRRNTLPDMLGIPGWQRGRSCRLS